MAETPTLTDLQQEVADQLSRIRSIDRLIGQPDFLEAFGAACPGCRRQAAELIAKSDRDGLARWIQEQQPAVDIGSRTIRELRQIGQRLGIPSYSNLPKALLLSEIERYGKAKGIIPGAFGTGRPGCLATNCA